MGVREALNSGGGRFVALGVALVAVAVLAVVAAGQLSDGVGDEPTAAEVYYYDIGTGKLFPHELEPQRIEGAGGAIIVAEDPAVPPSGATLADGRPGGLLAAVFACGSCNDESARFVSHVEAHAASVEARPVIMRNPEEKFIAAVPDLGTPAGELEWVMKSSPEGEAIVRRAMDRCGDEPPQPCAP